MAEIHKLSRDCPVTAIPVGDVLTLPAGTEVFIAQFLGGNVTVRTDHGLYRIAREQADAIEGYVPKDADHSPGVELANFSEEAVWDALKTCFDPEIPVNIVDLGLVYSMDVEKVTEPEPGHRVNVAMTLTAPGCGMGPAIAEDAKSKILLVPGVSHADVRITWDPPWNQQMISEEGKMKLGLI